MQTLDQLARRPGARWNPFHDAVVFPCVVCGKGVLARAIDGRLDLTRPCGHEVADAVGKDRQPEDRPLASWNGANPGNSRGLADEVRTAIQSNPQLAYESVLGEALTRKAGSREPVARCPFHDDGRPSLRISLGKGTWYCDPCAKGGDLFELARELWGLDFPACVSRLADLLGVTHSNGNPARHHALRTFPRLGRLGSR